MKSLPYIYLPILFALTACGTTPRSPTTATDSKAYAHEAEASPAAREVAMYSLMLLKTGYTFGGKNPEAGLDCSGMVSYVYREAAGITLTGNAAAFTRQGREVSRSQLRAGDLVFFNTLGRPFSHVGIYLGKGEFIHAPNSRSRVRVDKMTNPYWAKRFEMARTMF